MTKVLPIRRAADKDGAPHRFLVDTFCRCSVNDAE
jgi:hypothetical protein